MSKGKFIVIEGIDGAGKTVQVDILAKKLGDLGIPLHVTRECSDGPIGKLLRNTYLPGHRECDERVVNYLYAADRLDHISNSEDGMMHYIDRGINVLCDRYLMSSLAYDTYMYYGTAEFDNAMESIIQRNKVNMDLMTPDLTIFIDVAPEVAMKRINAGREEATIYENVEKLAKIRYAYLQSIKILRYRYHNFIETVDGCGSPEKVAADIWRHVYSYMKNHVEMEG